MAGNKLSGRHGSKMSDAEKKAKGIFDPRWSEQAGKDRMAAKIISGPWLSAVPKPDFALDRVGMVKYNELCNALLDQNKLTMVTRQHAQNIALIQMQISKMLTMGKLIPNNLFVTMKQSTMLLGIAEDAKNIGPPPKASESKWGFAGFANKKR
jgi:hypothetical protein